MTYTKYKVGDRVYPTKNAKDFWKNCGCSAWDFDYLKIIRVDNYYAWEAIKNGKIVNSCNGHDICDENLTPYPVVKTLDTLEVGDVVVSKYGDERTVLDFGLDRNVVHLSRYDNKPQYGTSTTIKELKEGGYTVKQYFCFHGVSPIIASSYN